MLPAYLTLKPLSRKWQTKYFFKLGLIGPAFTGLLFVPLVLFLLVLLWSYLQGSDSENSGAKGPSAESKNLS